MGDVSLDLNLQRRQHRVDTVHQPTLLISAGVSDAITTYTRLTAYQQFNPESALPQFKGKIEGLAGLMLALGGTQMADGYLKPIDTIYGRFLKFFIKIGFELLLVTPPEFI
jgi:hypothetical protein